MKTPLVFLTLSSILVLPCIAHANTTDNQRKTAIVKQVITKLGNRRTTIEKYASPQFKRVANYADAVAARDNAVSCAPLEMVGGQDYTQSRVTRSATYKVLNNGNVETRFKTEANSPVTVVEFGFIKENGKLMISDIYSDGDSFLSLTISCLEESDYL